MGIKNIIGELRVNGKPVLTEKHSEGLEFTSNNDGTCSVSGIGTCTDTEAKIPSISPDGDSVTAIGPRAFASCELTSVEIPSSVTTIMFSAFDSCTLLRNIIIPGSVTSFGYEAFCGCTNLTRVYYKGDEEQWAQIERNSGDAYTELSNATIVYNYIDDFISVNDRLGDVSSALDLLIAQTNALIGGTE